MHVLQILNTAQSMNVQPERRADFACRKKSENVQPDRRADPACWKKRRTITLTGGLIPACRKKVENYEKSGKFGPASTDIFQNESVYALRVSLPGHLTYNYLTYIYVQILLMCKFWFNRILCSREDLSVGYSEGMMAPATENRMDRQHSDISVFEYVFYKFQKIRKI